MSGPFTVARLIYRRYLLPGERYSTSAAYDWG